MKIRRKIQDNQLGTVKINTENLWKGGRINKISENQELARWPI